FEIVATSGATRRVPVPTYAMPKVQKRSAGYHASADMDLVDLFVGAEGTLGAIVDVELRVVGLPRRLLAWLWLDAEAAALALTARLRGERDVAAIESVDRPSLELLREDGVTERCGVAIPAGAQAALLVTLETRDHVEAALRRFTACADGL